MLSVEEALQRTLSLAAVQPPEEASIDEALGRALCEEVRAVRTVPAHDNSAMDGYAVRFEDGQAPGARLSVIETIFCGHPPTLAVGKGQCARIMTGAFMPRGADSVVVQERVTVDSPGVVTLQEAVRRRQHVRDAGEDARAGQPLLPAGTAI